MSDDNNDDFTSKIAVLLIGVGSAALVVTIYHCLATTWCNPRYRARVTREGRRPYRTTTITTTTSSVENSMAQLIPAYKYQKSASLQVGEGDDDDDDRTCAICLCEFEEGEELRTLPECQHSYHVACIDMWLYSHTNCPMCRTDATPSPQVVLTRRDSSEAAPDERALVYQDMGLLQEVILHSRTM